jgi:succinoglycan biosynthesis transport protein ExoP
MRLASSPSRPSLRGQFVDADFDLASLGALLWQKRYSILRPTIIVALLTFGVVLMIPPKYQSEARVLVIGRDNVYLRPDADKDIIDRGVVDQEAATSQAQLILSRDLASEVIAKLKLNELPEFDPALGNISLTKRVLGFLGVIKNPLAMTPEERVLEAYYDRLTVFPVEKSRVIVIDFLSENAELAARVANAIADAYLKRQQEAKQDQARSAGQWLSGEIDNLRKKVADSEAKVERSARDRTCWSALTTRRSRCSSSAISTRSLPPRARRRPTPKPKPGSSAICSNPASRSNPPMCSIPN